jgi:hypothetical protein
MEDYGSITGWEWKETNFSDSLQVGVCAVEEIHETDGEDR